MAFSFIRRLIILTFSFLPLSCGGNGRDASGRLAETSADLLSFRRKAVMFDSTMYATGVDSILKSRGFNRDTFVDGFAKLGTTPEEFQGFFSRVNQRALSASDTSHPFPR